MKTNNNMMIVFTVNSDGELMKKHQLTPFISIYHQHLVFIAISYCSHQFIKQNRLTVLRINSRFIENIVEAQEINKIDLLFTLCQNRLSCILNIYSSQLRGPCFPSPLCFSHVFMIAGSTRWPWETLTRVASLHQPAADYVSSDITWEIIMRPLLGVVIVGNSLILLSSLSTCHSVC